MDNVTSATHLDNREDFTDNDFKSLFRNGSKVANGPKAPLDAPKSAVGSYGKQPSARELVAQYNQSNPTNDIVQPTAQRPQQSYNPYQQYAQPVFAPDHQYKQLIGALLEIVGENVTHGEWVRNPVISEAIRVLQ